MPSVLVYYNCYIEPSISVHLQDDVYELRAVFCTNKSVKMLCTLTFDLG